MRCGMCWAYAAAGILFVSRSAASCCAVRLPVSSRLRTVTTRSGALAWQLGGIVLVVIAPLNYDLPNELMKVTCDKTVTMLKCIGTSRVAPRLCAQIAGHPPPLSLHERIQPCVRVRTCSCMCAHQGMFEGVCVCARVQCLALRNTRQHGLPFEKSDRGTDMMCQSIKDSGGKCDDEKAMLKALRGECYKALKTTLLECKCPEGTYDHTKYLCVRETGSECVRVCVCVCVCVCTFKYSNR